MCGRLLCVDVSVRGCFCVCVCACVRVRVRALCVRVCLPARICVWASPLPRAGLRAVRRDELRLRCLDCILPDGSHALRSAFPMQPSHADERGGSAEAFTLGMALHECVAHAVEHVARPSPTAAAEMLCVALLEDGR